MGMTLTVQESSHVCARRAAIGVGLAEEAEEGWVCPSCDLPSLSLRVSRLESTETGPAVDLAPPPPPPLRHPHPNVQWSSVDNRMACRLTCREVGSRSSPSCFFLPVGETRKIPEICPLVGRKRDCMWGLAREGVVLPGRRLIVTVTSSAVLQLLAASRNQPCPCRRR